MASRSGRQTLSFSPPGSSGFYYRQLVRARIPSFGGETCSEEAEKWLNEVESNFLQIKVPDKIKAQIVRPFLISKASQWWRTCIQPLPRPVTWAKFLEEFCEFFLSLDLIMQRIEEFDTLRQESGVTVSEYARRFITLGRYVPLIMEDEKHKVIRSEVKVC